MRWRYSNLASDWRRLLSSKVFKPLPKVALLFLSLTLGACSILSFDEDGPGDQISASSVRDAVPKRVTKSKYGNPKSYVVNGKRYVVKATSRGYVARGTASWYGKKFHGRRTSSGEIFDMYRATAAHTTLPLPTYATVTNLDNGKQVIVKINDRGPFHGDRIIDLSYGAAVKIGMASAGTGRVEVRVIDGTEPTERQTAAVPNPRVTNGTYVQLGAFKHFVNAQEMRARAQGAGLFAVSVDQTKNSTGESLYRVRVGPFVNNAKIESTIAKLQAAGISDYKLVEN